MFKINVVKIKAGIKLFSTNLTKTFWWFESLFFKFFSINYHCINAIIFFTTLHVKLNYEQNIVG